MLAGQDEAGPSSHKRSRIDDDGEDYTPSSSSPSFLVEALLHPQDVIKILNSAPTPAVRTAWREGTPPPSNQPKELEQRQLRRFRVGENRAYDDSGYAVWAKMKERRETHDEGREWFEEGVRMAGVCE